MSAIRMPKFRQSQPIYLINNQAEPCHEAYISDFKYCTMLSSESREPIEGWFYQVKPSLVEQEDDWFCETALRTRHRPSTLSLRQMISKHNKVPNA